MVKKTARKKKEGTQYPLWLKIKCAIEYRDKPEGVSGRDIARDNDIRDQSSLGQWRDNLPKLEQRFLDTYGEPWSPYNNPEDRLNTGVSNLPAAPDNDILLAGEMALAKENKLLREENEDLKYMNKLLIAKARGND